MTNKSTLARIFMASVRSSTRSSANRPPAQGTTLEEIYQNVSAGRIARAREVDLAVPAALDAICAQGPVTQSRRPVFERIGTGG